MGGFYLIFYVGGEFSFEFRLKLCFFLSLGGNIIKKLVKRKVSIFFLLAMWQFNVYNKIFKQDFFFLLKSMNGYIDHKGTFFW